VTDTVTIAPQYNGPLETGQGGYVAGLIAQALGVEAAEVTLRAPAPLGRELRVERDGAYAALLDGDRIVAEGAPATPQIEPPEPVSFDDALAVRKQHPYFAAHPYPTCFGCGPKRREGDGLCIYPGRLADRDAVAAPWMPHLAFADADGHVRPEVVWAAIDCPSAFALGDEALGLLGRFTGELLAPVEAGRPHVLVGWPLGGERRKRYSACALFDDNGALLAISSAVWIAPA
jgi:hypothetical protein